jgi:GYF domain 2
MSNRAWFYASGGQQHGPYPEVQLREFIARGTVTPDTLVWTEGMVNWQRAYLRSRIEPSWATEATSVPSGLKIMPRVRPRPPRALGESWA